MILKTFTVLLMVAVLSCGSFGVSDPAFAATTQKSKSSSSKKKSGYNPRYASIVIDADTGAVLSESNSNASVHPASLAKMMTLLLVFERLENGALSLNQRIYISNRAAAQQPSKLGLPAGSSIALKDAIYALVTKSANDISVAIAENVGGSEAHFVYLMNEKAKEIGMTRTNFKNPHGLHNSAQVTTARDIARLSRYLIKAYPNDYRYFSTSKFTYNGITNRNHNRLMETYPGMDGIKTGYIVPSGFNLAASAVRGKHRLIAVVFGGKTTASRNAEVASLLDRGFEKINRTETSTLVAQNNAIRIPAPQQLDARLTSVTGTTDRRTPSISLIPPRKPGQTSPATKTAQIAANQEPIEVPQTGAMGEIAGQGDVDPAVTRRFETGMMAIAAIKGSLKPGQISSAPTDSPEAAQPRAKTNGLLGNGAGNIAQSNDWAIQLGSYSSRVKSDEVLASATEKLPQEIRASARPVIVPMKAGDGWIYRARLHGLSREQASAACKYFNNCMAISPRAF